MLLVMGVNFIPLLFIDTGCRLDVGSCPNWKKVTKSTRLFFSLSTQVSFSWIALCMRIFELNWSIFYVIQNSCVCNFYGTTLWKIKVIIPHGEIAHNPSSVWSYLLGKIGIPQHRSGSSGKVLFFIQNFLCQKTSNANHPCCK